MSRDPDLLLSSTFEEKKPRDDDEPLGSLSSFTTRKKMSKKNQG